MYAWWTTGYVLTVICAIATNEPGYDVQEGDSSITDQRILVNASVLDLTLDGVTATAILSIRNVYVGSEDWIGKRFSVSAPKQLRSGTFGADALVPPLQLGEQGIWLLRVKAGGLQMSTERLYGRQWPARERVHRDFADALLLAQTVESLERADIGARNETLKELGLSGTPQVSPWAIEELGRIGGEANGAFLQEMTRQEKLSPSSQVALDSALVRLMGQEWCRSQRRWQYLFRGASSKLNSDSANDLVAYLELAVQHGTLEPEQVFTLLEAIVRGEAHNSVEVRVYALLAMRRNVPRLNNDALAITFYSGIVRDDSSDRTLRLQAVHALRDLVLSAGQMQTLKDISDTIRDEIVRKSLREILGEK